MYIMYLGVNREGKLECKCGIFIVNAEFVLSGCPLLFRSSGFLFYYLQKCVSLTFFVCSRQFAVT